MIDIFWYYLSSLGFCCVFGALLCVYRYYLGNRLNKSADKLKSQMANIRRDFPIDEESRGAFVGKSIEGMGVEGIIDSLGLPSILKPVAKGLIDSYLKDPEKLKGLLSKLGVKIPNADSNEATGLL
jgi:hypothetical protein